MAIHGLDDAIARGRLYREAGADMIFVEAPRSVDDMRRICAEIDAPVMANNIEGGLTPLLPATELEAIGYAMVAFPVATTYAVAAAIRSLMQHLHGTGTTAGWPGEMLDFESFNRLVGLPTLRDAEERDLAFARRLAGSPPKD